MTRQEAMGPVVTWAGSPCQAEDHGRHEARVLQCTQHRTGTPRVAVASNEEKQGAKLNASFPVAALTVLGMLAVLLGFFAAGEILVVALGFGALVAAGLINALESRTRSSEDRPVERI